MLPETIHRQCLVTIYRSHVSNSTPRRNMQSSDLLSLFGSTGVVEDTALSPFCGDSISSASSLYDEGMISFVEIVSLPPADVNLQALL